MLTALSSEIFWLGIIIGFALGAAFVLALPAISTRLDRRIGHDRAP